VGSLHDYAKTNCPPALSLRDGEDGRIDKNLIPGYNAPAKTGTFCMQQGGA